MNIHLRLILTCSLTLLIVALLSAQPAGNNRLYGKVTMPAVVKKGGITRGQAYRNRTETAPSEEKQRIDEENRPDRNVIVILYPLDFKPALKPVEDAVLQQREKTFIPNVLPVTKGSTVIIENGDDFFHNVFSLTPGAQFNIGRRPPGNRRSQLIDRSGEVKVFCDVHPQMNATILSLETPYFVRVDNAGSYSLDRLPDGRYRAEVYHPHNGILRREVNLRGGAAVQQHFNFQDDQGSATGMNMPESGILNAACCTPKNSKFQIPSPVRSLGEGGPTSDFE